MNRMTGPGIAWNTKPHLADGSMILIPFPGKTTITSEKLVMPSKQGK